MPVAFEELTPRIAAFLAPLPAASASGVSARLEPEYQAVANEVAKVDSLTGATVDWGAVARGAAGILQSRSKDLVIAAYLAHALQSTRGIEGLTDGLALLAALLDQHWDALQPDAKRLRGRANALQWFVDHAISSTEALPEGSASAGQAEALGVAAGRLADVSRQRLGEASPAFGRLLAAVNRLAPVSESATPSPAQPTGQPAPSPPAPPQASFQGANPAETLERLASALVDLAARLREASPVDPAAYRALRTGLWLHLDVAPAAREGRTSIPPPPPALLGRMTQLVENQQWAALLEEVESSLPQQRFALDLQRLGWQALAGLGTSHERARAAVAAELRSLLARMPSLPSLAFSDGSPLADARTRAWMDDVVVARPAAARPSPSVEQADPVPIDEPARWLSEGRIADALGAFQQALGRLPPGRARFLLQLDIARAYSGAGLAPLALAAFQSLDAEVRLRGLETWEPALAVETLKGVIATVRALVKDPRAASSQLDDCYRRLCGLDPAAAFEVWP